MDVLLSHLIPHLDFRDQSTLRKISTIHTQMMSHYWRQMCDLSDTRLNLIIQECCVSGIKKSAESSHRECVKHGSPLLILAQSVAVLIFDPRRGQHYDHWPYTVFCSEYPSGDLRKWRRARHNADWRVLRIPEMNTISKSDYWCKLCNLRDRINIHHLWTSQPIQIDNPDQIISELLSNTLRVTDGQNQWYLDILSGERTTNSNPASRVHSKPTPILECSLHRHKQMDVRNLRKKDKYYRSMSDWGDHAFQSPINGDFVSACWIVSYAEFSRCALIIDSDCRLIRDRIPLASCGRTAMFLSDDELMVLRESHYRVYSLKQPGQYTQYPCGHGCCTGIHSLDALGLRLPSYHDRNNPLVCLGCGKEIPSRLQPYLNCFSIVQGCSDLSLICEANDDRDPGLFTLSLFQRVMSPNTRSGVSLIPNPEYCPRHCSRSWFSRLLSWFIH